MTSNKSPLDFQSIVDIYAMAAAVLSVEKTDDGHYGEIRIVKANELYKKIMGKCYRDNMLYTELIPRELNFEDFCYRCAVHKQHLHAYVDTKSMGVWTDGTYIPLSVENDSKNLSYLLFFFEFTSGPESEKMSDVSLDTAPFIIQTCITLRGSDNFYESMNTVIADIQKKTDSFASVIFMIDKEKQKFAPLCAKYRNDAATIDDFLPYFSPEIVFSWEDMLKKKDSLIIKDEFDLAELEKINPLWAKSLRDAQVENVILLPLSQGKKMFGVLFITNFNIKKIVEIKQFIELAAFFLSSEIASNDLMEKLEYMSNIDLLTGVKNRNAMNARVDWHTSGQRIVKAPYGIVFADLNGLKQCNDSGGHEAGDALLRNAAELLKKHFEDDEIYRSGGDEFIIIVSKCSQEDFENRLKNLRTESGCGASVCFAIGSSWNSGDKDLRLCMHLADESMYTDKKEFYRLHPEKAR